MTLREGLRLTLPPSFPAAQSYREDSYERELTDWFLATVQPGWTVVDGGANIGYYTVLAARRVGPSGRVFAFEPDPTNFAYLVRNIAANGCTNVVASPRALSDRAGRSAFRKDRFYAEGHLLPDQRLKPDQLRVDTVRLDDCLSDRDVPAVDLIKLDLEGGEVRALRGMVAIARRSPLLQIVVECNPRAQRRAGSTPSGLLTTLGNLGFRWAKPVERAGPQILLDGRSAIAEFTQNLLITR